MMCVMHDSPPEISVDGGPQSQLNRQELQRIALLTEQVRLQQQVMAFTMAAQATPQIRHHTEVLRAQMQQQHVEPAEREKDDSGGRGERS